MSGRFVSAAALVLLVSGCVTVGQVESLPHNVGYGRRYATDLLSAVQASRQAFAETKTQIKRLQQVNDTTWLLLGTQPESFFSYGEIVRVLLTPGGTDSIDVRIYARKKMEVNVFAEGKWHQTFYSLISAQLGDTGSVLPRIEEPVPTGYRKHM